MKICITIQLHGKNAIKKEKWKIFFYIDNEIP